MTKVRGYLFRPLYDHSGFLEMRHFGGFDGVRALAAVMVVFFHFGGHRAAFSNGWLGVQLFFVLSGFLITTLLLREERIEGRVSIGNFWIRRVFRILPAYYLVLVVTVAILVFNGMFQDAGGPQSIWFFATMNPEFAPTMMNFGQAWTIGVEQKFYLVWPLLAFVLVGPSLRRRAGLWVVLLMGLVVGSFSVWAGMVHYAVILLGCGLALAFNSPRAFHFLRFLRTRFVAVIGLLGLLAVHLLAGPISFAFHTEDTTVLLYGFFAAVALPGLCAVTPTTRLLSKGPFRWFGQRSYSIYLVQLLAGGVVVSVLRINEVGLLTAILVTAVSALMADLIFRWVEQPMIRLGKRIARRQAEDLVSAKVSQIG